MGTVPAGVGDRSWKYQGKQESLAGEDRWGPAHEGCLSRSTGSFKEGMAGCRVSHLISSVLWKDPEATVVDRRPQRPE